MFGRKTTGLKRKKSGWKKEISGLKITCGGGLAVQADGLRHRWRRVSDFQPSTGHPTDEELFPHPSE
jgi:hypothetical protein